MDIEKCIKDGLIGGAGGLALGIVLWVPSCIVGGIAKGTERQGENVANGVFWLCLIGGAIIGFLVSLAEEQKKETERQRAEQERRRQAEERERLEQNNIQSSLVHTAEASLNLFESMPARLLTSEQFLDQAERDFNEGAFSPFWSSIEKAMAQLGAFDDGVRVITTNFNSFGELTKRYKATSPRFPIAIDSVRNMAAANTTVERLNTIVRKAQRNFQFATIYEQRKTNQLLTAGFTTLAQALDGMGQRIASSIDDLGSQISEMSDTMESSLGAIGEQLQATNESLTESIDALHSTTKAAASESKVRADRQWEALDNIQRHRKPIGSRPMD
jgi:hypothetical protein